ncbi:hypothetical protein HZH66_010686 [Vespula vulgaris]|uniref:Uncharacterized protein n=1 Tax=Vespula vulgaris TaxID=7454 RepID=A0A834MY16_VESVU|nr:hypothetical protein HZH66_010686 [Vespula vulgaris]
MTIKSRSRVRRNLEDPLSSRWDRKSWGPFSTGRGIGFSPLRLLLDVDQIKGKGSGKRAKDRNESMDLP